VTAEGVDVLSTVGISHPTWASGSDGSWSGQPGTINIVAGVPVPMSDAAMVNLVMTVTEAKSQALFDLAIPGTGTASDAVCILSPVAADQEDPEAYGGPRSTWGARLARAVYQSVLASSADA
jgi:adenosylcobinamide amidohydrolase